MIIIDENFDNSIIKHLREIQYDLLSIKEKHKGISDHEIIQMVIQKNAILITEDKDFGELVFSHGIKGANVIFLRYSLRDIEQIIKNISLVLKEFDFQGQHHFITVTKSKIRNTTI